MTDLFETILSQLAEKLHVSLRVDRHGACAFKINQKFLVQLQLDSSREQLLAVAFVYTIAPGRFCENVFCEALKANNLPDPRAGIFGYLAATSQLTLHQIYPVLEIGEETLALYVANLIDYATLWHDSLEQGRLGPAPIHSPPVRPRGFGQKP